METVSNMGRRHGGYKPLKKKAGVCLKKGDEQNKPEKDPSYDIKQNQTMVKKVMKPNFSAETFFINQSYNNRN